MESKYDDRLREEVLFFLSEAEGGVQPAGSALRGRTAGE